MRNSSTNAAISGATVTFNGVSTTTNTSGVYTLTNVACVSSTLTVSKSGYQTASIGYSLAACGGTSTKDVTLTPSSSTLTGTVRNSSTNAAIS
ncbi:MAG: carboxypeptidase regulatory-like domain-containing protein, partial [Acidobacteriota bacterium]